MYWRIKTSEPVDFDNMKMFAAGDWYEPVDGKIKNKSKPRPIKKRKFWLAKA